MNNVNIIPVRRKDIDIVRSHLNVIVSLIHDNLERVNSKVYSAHVIDFMKDYYSFENFPKRFGEMDAFFMITPEIGAFTHKTANSDNIPFLGRDPNINNLIGVGGFKIKSEASVTSRVAEVKCMFINTAYHGNGFGRLLLNKIEDVARREKIKSLVLNSSLNARDFYEKSGFKCIRFMEDDDFGNTFLMEKEI